MKLFIIGFALMCTVLVIDAAMAQQQDIPLTDWRSSLDVNLSKLSMPREAHMAIYSILQAYEKQAQMEKLKPAEPPK